MTPEQLKEIQALSWEWARFAGFDKLSDIETRIALNREIAEAWEVRDRRCKSRTYHLGSIGNDSFNLVYNNRVNNTLESELADICLILVRTLDDFENLNDYKRFSRDFANSFEDYLLLILKKHNYKSKLASVIVYCQQNNIDLYNHCKLKLKYNYTRPEYIAKNKELNNEKI